MFFVACLLLRSAAAQCDVLSTLVNGTCVQVVAGGAILDDDQSAFNDPANAADLWETGRRRATPDSINWNPLNKNGVPTKSGPVKNQHSCGSCTVYSAVLVLEIWANVFRQQQSPNAPVVVLNTLNQVHCLQKYFGRSHMVCAGNKHQAVTNALQALQERVRRAKQPSGTLNIDDSDDPINGPYIALPDACVESASVDPLIPILSPANPVTFKFDTSVVEQFGSVESWRRLFSPMVFDFKLEDHERKLASVQAALQYGPLTVTTFLCGDFGFASDAELTTFKGCPTDVATILRVGAHRVTFVGYVRAATLDASYFIVQNSWGAHWGAHNGFARFSMSLWASRYWGEAVLFLVRPHNSLYNPKQPKWSDTESRLLPEFFRLPDGAKCNTGPAESCQLRKGVAVALPLPLVAGAELLFNYHVSKVVVMRELRFTLVVGAPKAPTASSVSFRVAIKEPNRAWRNSTLSDAVVFSQQRAFADVDDALVWRAAAVALPLGLTQPLGLVHALSLQWLSDDTVADASEAKIYITDIRMASIDAQTSLQVTTAARAAGGDAPLTRAQFLKDDPSIKQQELGGDAPADTVHVFVGSAAVALRAALALPLVASLLVASLA